MRRFIAYAILACVVLVIVFAALTNKPPEPFVRVDDFRATSYHLERIECVDKREVRHYRRDDGRPMGAAITDNEC